VWTISSSGARGICAGSCEHMLAITMTSERTGHCTKMRRLFVPFNGSATSRHKPSSVGFITATFGFRFSVHTAPTSYRQRTPQNPSEPERGMREGKITVLSWECKVSHRLGITRTRTDADGSHATRNGRSQRPVPQLPRRKHRS